MASKTRKQIYGDSGKGTASDRIRSMFGVEPDNKLKIVKENERKRRQG